MRKILQPLKDIPLKYIYNNKKVLVTGGGTGLGKKMAETYSNLGAEVIISSRNLNVLQELQIDFADGVFFNNALKFPEISVRIKKSGDEQYQANVIGDLEEFELYESENFIGLLPRSNFLIDLEIDGADSKVTSVSKINFNTLSAADIVGIFDIKFISELLTKLECEFVDCDLSDFEMSYEIKLDDEWIKGSANCEKSVCGLEQIDHVVRTSNTVNIFRIVNQANILNPLYSLYLYGTISSGRKMNDGHELKFQF